MPENRKLYTLVLVRNETKVLLGFKKRGFGVGKWNGFGGKVESDESIVEAALRELHEESGVLVRKDDLEKVGILQFDFEDMPDLLMEVHVFTATVYDGEPLESEEMLPKWFNFANIPYDDMWADDRIWFPFFLEGRKFLGKFKFRDSKTIMYMELQFVDEVTR